MTSEMQNLIGTSEEDEELDLDVKEEDDDNDSEDKNNASTSIGGFDGPITSSKINRRLQHQFPNQEQLGSLEAGRRGRPIEEKERTKLRERHRRAITARILTGLRRHGNYNLRVRADINDVITALAREAGWVVLPDGTTFPSRSQVLRPAGGNSSMMASSPKQIMSPQTPVPLRGDSSNYQISAENNTCRMKGVFLPTPSIYDLSTAARSQNSVVDGEQMENHVLVDDSMNTINDKQDRDFAGTSYVPVYMMLPLGVINMKCELVDPDGLFKQLRLLKSINVDGVKVNCWWGIVETHTPQEYIWNGYKRLFQIVHELKLKLQVVMLFNECGGNVGDDVCIPLPHWVAEIGRSNPNIFFTDKEGRHNPECLSWGVDKERVFLGRTAIEVYYDFMRSFRVEFNEFFEYGVISMIEVGLGPCGDLRYPSYPVKHGWRFPGIGEFQCYDQYLLKKLRKAAEGRGCMLWARGPDNDGTYNSRPHETGFFCDGGDYDGYYGRFFLSWYSKVLVDHGDQVLSLAKLAFEGTCIAAKLSGIHWWYKTASHAAELTAGFYNPCNRDGYAAIVAMLKKHGATLNLTTAEMPTLNQHDDFSEALADPDGLIWQVMNAAWDMCIPVASESCVPCYSREGYDKILHNAKPMNSPDKRIFSSFTYRRLTPILMDTNNFVAFKRFVTRMHGEAVLDP